MLNVVRNIQKFHQIILKNEKICKMRNPTTVCGRFPSPFRGGKETAPKASPNRGGGPLAVVGFANIIVPEYNASNASKNGYVFIYKQLPMLIHRRSKI